MDNKPSGISGFLHGAQNVTASENIFHEVHGNYSQNIHQQFIASPFPEAVELYPAQNLSLFFTGQQSYLQILKDYFFPDSTDAPLARRSFLLYGEGGIGKTQVCLKFLEDAQANFSMIFWINSSSEVSILSSLQDIADAYHLQSGQGSLTHLVLSWISRLEGNWIVVFDHAEVGYKMLRKYLPPGTGGNVLITSRSKIIERVTGHHSLAIDPMAMEDGVVLLLRSGNISHKHSSTAVEIVSKLNCAPYLIDQAGEYIHAHNCDLEKFLELYEGKGSLDELKEFLGELINGRQETLGEYSEEHLGTIEMMHNFATGLNKLKEWKESEEWGLKAVKGREKYFGKNNLLTVETKSILASSYAGQEKWEKAEELGTQVVKSRIALLGEDHLETLQAMHSLLIVLNELKKWLEAEVWGLKTVNGRKEKLGMQNLLTLESILALAVTYQGQERLEKVYELAFQVVESKIAFLGENHPDIFGAMYFLLVSLIELENWVEAEAWGIRTVKGRKQHLGMQSLLTLDSMLALAVVYEGQGNLEKAKELGSQVVENRIALLGENHPETLGAMHFLLVRLSGMKKYAKSELWHLRANWRKQHSEMQSLLTLENMLDLAIAYGAEGKWERTLELEMKVVEGRMVLLGEDHPRTLDAMHILLLTLNRLDKFAEAEIWGLRAVKGRKVHLGMQNLYTLETMFHLAIAYGRQKKLQMAQELGQQVVEGRIALLGEDHPETHEAVNFLIVTLDGLHKWSEVEGWALRFINGRKEKKSLNTLETMSLLAMTYSKQEKYEKAKELAREVAQGKRDLLGEDHMNTIGAQKILEIIQRNQKEFQVENWKLNSLVQSHLGDLS